MSEAARMRRARSTRCSATGFATPSWLARRSRIRPGRNEVDGGGGNERLEFLGDAVLDLVIADALYAAHPDWAEGELTRARAALVNQRALAEVARGLGLGRLVRLGRTEQRSSGGDKDRVLANCLEALIGAVFLDGGLEPASALLRRLFASAIEAGGAAATRDPKTASPGVGAREAPHHAELRDGRATAASSTTRSASRSRSASAPRRGDRGTGRSKRSAEQAAARAALARRDGDDG